MSRASPPPAARKPAVLFLCSANSARSQMAEGLLRRLAGARFDVHSAGLEAKGIHPLTHQVMAELGIDTTSQRSKDLGEFLGRVNVQHAIIVCDSAAQRCPSLYPFARQVHRWPFDDPAAAVGTEEQRLEKFREVRDAIDARLREWLDELRSAAGES